MTIATPVVATGDEPERVQPNSRRGARDDSGPAPERAPDLQLLGSEAASGHRRPPSLVRRGDGQTIQLTPLLYQVLALIDGGRSLPEIAAVVSEEAGKIATADDIRFLIDRKLRPLGLLRAPGDGASPNTKANPLLALRCRVVVSNPEITDAVANKFAPLFRPGCVAVVMAAFIASTGWVMFDVGLAHPARQTLYDPALLLAVFALTVASAAFHEVGHAAACRYGGARPGVMGAGLYLLWPAFYTDVSDAYRLSRWSRLRVDLGGMYFNAVFAVGAMALYWASGSDALLIIVPLQLLQMLRHLAPIVRLDGYHILADLTGVPDLFAHIGPTLKGLLPWRWGRPENKTLRPSARFVVTAWVLIIMPMLMYTFVMLVIVLPRLAATTWDSLGFRWTALTAAYSKGDIYTAGATVLTMGALALPLLSISYLISRTVRRIVRRVWHDTEGRPGRRALAALAGAGIVALLVSAWIPDSQRTPIATDEHGTLPVPGVNLTPAASHRSTVSTSPASTARTLGPAAGGPSAAGAKRAILVAVPRTDSGAVPAAPSGLEWQSPIGKVRFNPPTPREGDNYAVAVNTQDGSFLTVAKFSLVFADGDTVDNRNRAYALANCHDCSTGAVAFQVILIVTDAHVITPDNLAVAINAACASCHTQALSMQLIATTGPLSDETIGRLLDVWRPLADLQQRIASTSFEAVKQQLYEVESQLLGILTQDDAITWSTSGAQQTGTDQSVSATTSTTTTPSTPATPPTSDSTTASSSTSEPTTTTASSTPATTDTSAPPATESDTTTTTTEPAPTASSSS